MPLAENKAKKVLDRVLAQVGKAKGAAATASLTHSRGGNTRFAVNEITSSGDAERVELSVTVQFGLRSADASTNQLDDASIDDVVARAVRMARLAPEDPESMPPLGRQKYLAAPDASDEATASFTAAGRARGAGTAIQQAEAQKVAIAGFYEHAVASQSLATSAGLWAHRQRTTSSYSCTARTADGTGSGWAGAASHRVADIDADTLARIAVDKAVRSAKPRKLDPGKYTVILEPAAVAPLLQWLTWAFAARRADEGRSFFAKGGGATKVGDKLFPDAITLRTDPGDLAIGSTFDGEGFPLAPTRWIDKGKVTGLYYTRYWAKKQGKTPTGGPRGWILDPGSATREQLIKGVKRGVLITRFWYLRYVDPQSILVTGLTRDGVFLIENGEVAASVNNFRFNDSPVTMLSRCDGLTSASVLADADGPRIPTLRTHEFNLASISEAV